ncbi:MAG: sodium:solute symporter family protein [Candidatus Dependentiae bacterium]|jgi:SSS family solute:Na+ symporter
MNIILFSSLFLLFAVIYWALGVYAARSVTTHDDYFLADRSLGFWSLTATLIATQLGGGVILGAAKHAYDFGIQGIFYSLGMCIGFLLLGMGIASRFREFHVTTMAELFEKQFDSVRLKKVASLLSIIALSGIFIGQVVASKSLLVGLGVHNEAVFISFWILLVGYTMYGGLPAVVITDIMQVLIILAVFVGLFASMWWQGSLLLPTGTQLGSLASGFDSSYAMSFLVMPILFSLVEQDLAQRFFAARSKGVAMASALAASVLVLLFSFIPVSFGMQAAASSLEIPDGANPLISFLELHTSPFMYALVMCALVAAIASTADSLLCAISSNVVHDFVPVQADGTRSMIAARSLTAVVGIAGVVGAYYVVDILHMLTQSYEVLVCTTLVPVLVCLTPLPRIRAAATAAVIAGALSFCVVTVWGSWCGMPRPLICLLASVVAYGLVTLFTVLSGKRSL